MDPKSNQLQTDSDKLLELAIESNLQMTYENRIEAHENTRQLMTDLCQAGEALRMTTEIVLAKPHIKYKDSFLKGLEEIQVISEKSSWVYLGDSAPLDISEKDFNAYVQSLLRRETEPPPEFVCDTIFWAIHADEVVGRIAIRHELNDFLKKVGGHIGYITRPSFRGKGIASEMLKKILSTERAKSIGKLLLTCDENNVASEKTILKNCGQYTGTFSAGPNRSVKKHFWIDLNDSSA